MMPFPWEEAMQFGFGVLRLAPHQFWRMTPRELAAAFRAFERASASVAAPERRVLAGLMRAYPDNEVKR